MTLRGRCNRYGKRCGAARGSRDVRPLRGRMPGGELRGRDGPRWPRTRSRPGCRAVGPRPGWWRGGQCRRGAAGRRADPRYDGQAAGSDRRRPTPSPSSLPGSCAASWPDRSAMSLPTGSGVQPCPD